MGVYVIKKIYVESRKTRRKNREEKKLLKEKGMIEIKKNIRKIKTLAIFVH